MCEAQKSPGRSQGFLLVCDHCSVMLTGTDAVCPWLSVAVTVATAVPVCGLPLTLTVSVVAALAPDALAGETEAETPLSPPLTATVKL